MKLRIEHLYVLYTFSFPLHGKIGISEKPERRRREVEADLRRQFGEHIRVRRLIALPVITSAYAFEQAIHRALSRLQSRTLRGTTGGSEWFWAFNPVCGILLFFWLWANGNEKAVTAALFLTFVPIPLDFALYVVLLAAFEYGAAVGLVWLIFLR